MLYFKHYNILIHKLFEASEQLIRQFATNFMNFNALKIYKYFYFKY